MRKRIMKITSFLKGMSWGIKFGRELHELEKLSKHYTVVTIGRDSLPVASYLKSSGIKARFLPVSTQSLPTPPEYADIKKARKIGKETKDIYYRKLYEIMWRLEQIYKTTKKPLLLVDFGAIKGSHLLYLGELTRKLKIPFGIASVRKPDLFNQSYSVGYMKWKKFLFKKHPSKTILKYESSIPKFIGSYQLPGIPEKIFPGKYQEYKTYKKGFILGAKLRKKIRI